MAAAAAPARVLTPPSEVWQWPKKYQPKERFLSKHKLPNECDFDYEVRRLNLKGASINRLIESTSLRYWAMLNAQKKYVPTDLLSAWGIVVNFDAEYFPW